MYSNRASLDMIMPRPKLIISPQNTQKMIPNFLIIVSEHKKSYLRDSVKMSLTLRKEKIHNLQVLPRT